MLFIGFDAEEGGLRGARAFVSSPPVPRDSIVMNVNLDMVSRSDKRLVAIAGASSVAFSSGAAGVDVQQIERFVLGAAEPAQGGE